MRGTVNEHDVRQALFDLSNEGQPNGTGQAILSGLREQGFVDGTVEARVPFSSARKWSSIYDGNAVWTMGAPEVILSQINGDHADILKQVNDLANDGNRVLLVARIYGAAPDDYETDPNSIRHRALSHWCAVPNIFAPTPKKRLHGSVNKACVAASSLVTIP